MPKQKLEDRAFTLVELLVSMGVLALLVVVVTGLMNSTTASTTLSRKHMDADAEARLVFDRMASDFALMVKRKDGDWIFKCVTSDISRTQVGNDSLFFYCAGPGYHDPAAIGTDLKLSLVGYRINSQTLQLERLNRGLDWIGTSTEPAGTFWPYYSTAAGPKAQSLASRFGGAPETWLGSPPDYNDSTLVSTTSSTSSANDIYYQVLSDSVYRMEYCFLTRGDATVDSNISEPAYVNYLTDPSNTPATSPQVASTIESTNGRVRIERVAGVLVAIAILDNNSRATVDLSSATTRTALASAFVDVGGVGGGTIPARLAPTQLMSPTWHAALSAPNFATTAGLNKLAASAVRIYQRCFYFDR